MNRDTTWDNLIATLIVALALLFLVVASVGAQEERRTPPDRRGQFLRCDECAKAGKKSSVRLEKTSHADMRSVNTVYIQVYPTFDEFWDEAGVYHRHDNDIPTATYRCSEGHTWAEMGSGEPCPACGYDFVQECSAQLLAPGVIHGAPPLFWSDPGIQAWIIAGAVEVAR